MARFSIVVLFSLILAFCLKAADHYWIGGDGSWSDGTNWSLINNGPSCNCVPGAGDRVYIDPNGVNARCFIPNGVNALASFIQIGTADTLEIGDASTIGSVATLMISDPPDGTGLVNIGIVNVFDTLRITEIGTSGIDNFGTITLDGRGVIDIHGKDDVGTIGFSNRKELTIERGFLGRRGRLLVNNCTLGFYNYSLAHVENVGIIRLEEFSTISGATVREAMSIDVNSTFINQSDGRIFITLPTTVFSSHCIVNNGHLTNHGQVTLAGSGTFGIKNEGVGITDNKGTFTIQQFRGTAIENQSEFINSGFLNINNPQTSAPARGIVNKGNFANTAGGSILCTDFQFPNSLGSGILNADTFDNLGNISISRLLGSPAISQNITTAYFINQNLITLDSGFTTGLNLNSGHFENTSSISIRRGRNYGIVLNQGILSNLGTIEVDQALVNTMVGIRIEGSGQILNGINALILIKDFNGRDGISQSSGVINNLGEIKLDFTNTFTNSYMDITGGVFDVSVGGVLQIENP